MIELLNQKMVVVSAYIMMLLSVVLSPFLGSVAIIFAVVIFCISCFFLNYQYAYVLLFGMFPFANIFKLDPSSFSMITLCEVILCAVVLIEKFILQKNLKINFRFFISLVLMCIAIFLFSVNTFSLSLFLKLIVKTLLIFYFFNNRNDFKLKEQTFIWITFALSIGMIVMMFVSRSPYYFDSVIDYLRVVKYDSESDLIRNSGLMIDPNYCSIAIIITVSVLAVNYYFEKINLSFWLLSIPLFLIGFTTYSKSYFLCAIIFLFFFSAIVLFPTHKSFLLCFVIVVAVFLVLAFRGKIDAINLVMARFKEGDLTTGRSYLNQVYIDYIISDMKVLLFGEGYSVAELSWTNNVHNLYIETLFKLGIVGTILYILLIKSCFPPIKKKIKAIVLLPVFFAIVMYAALAGLASYELMYYIIICGSAICFTDNYQRDTKLTEEIS